MGKSTKPGTTIALGAALMALGIALGAFGAHGLEARVTSERLDTWNTGVLYHLVHALALVIVGVLSSVVPSLPLRWTHRLFIAGIALFSGSLYLLVLLDMGPLGAVTPFGGVSFIAAWIALARAATGLNPTSQERT